MPLRLYVGYEMSDKKTEALKLALEALEESLGYVQEEAENAQRLYGQYPARQARIQGLKDDARKHMDAITAIREALAEQCVCGEPDTLGTHRTDGPCLAEQPAQQQEPVAWITKNGKGWLRWHKPEDSEKNKDSIPLYTAPTSKPWVGLTQTDLVDCDEEELKQARYWENKLKEKNT